MPEIPEGAPCWADAMLPNLEAGKQFYGELLGWTFDEGAKEYGGYTQAFSDGKNVAALMPQMPEQEGMPAAWSVYFSTSDIQATAARIRDNGGQLLTDPMQVGEFGSMLMATDPSGVVFGAWQPGTHKGFEKKEEPGSVAWVEIGTNDVAAVDAFYPAVFPTITPKRMLDEHMDYAIWKIGDAMVAGRFALGPGMPGPKAPHVAICFAVDDCDDAATTVTKLGGQVTDGPMDSPYGRIASVVDQQGAAFTVLDPSRTVGEMPQVED
ncbi:VOC family protein [Streptomyces sp. 6N223]|uniref:VOC family protein n=1 Tax=Streptomyces sp. 6N223 TaxID=3457412 RepID=UPI003FD51611